MKYAVNEEGVNALNMTASSIVDAVNIIYQDAVGVQNASEGHGDILGPHRNSLNGALIEIYQGLKTAAEPVQALSSQLKEVAECYQEIIDNDLLVHGDSGQGGGASAQSSTRESATTRQTAHKDYIETYKEQVAAVKSDVKSGSGQEISDREAEKMLYGIHSFSGTASTRVRSAYNNPNADPKDAEIMQSVDSYIHSSPKWEGTVFRGINVSESQAAEILSGNTVDMLGPSSWSSDLSVAERFSNGYKDVQIVFVLGENKSGASITHISSWDGVESEVTAPSGVKYHIEKVKKVKKGNSEIIYVDVHE